jgi:hypothetical protein
MPKNVSAFDNWIGAASREDSTPPVLWLRETATRLGLLRKHQGELRVTKLGAAVADDPVGLLAHCRLTSSDWAISE